MLKPDVFIERSIDDNFTLIYYFRRNNAIDICAYFFHCCLFDVRNRALSDYK